MANQLRDDFLKNIFAIHKQRNETTDDIEKNEATFPKLGVPNFDYVYIFDAILQALYKHVLEKTPLRTVPELVESYMDIYIKEKKDDDIKDVLA